MGKHSSRTKTLLFSVLPLIFFLFFLEAGIRTFGETQPNRVLCYDPILGRSYCPSTSGYLKENSVSMFVEINADGLLGKPYPTARTDGKLRIAILGDSFTSGEAVSSEKRFSGVWEKNLSKRFLPGVEVINFGVGGTGTWQQLQMFHTKTRKYKPDLTVLVFCWCNDLDNNIDQFNNKGDSRNPLLDQYEVGTWTKLKVKRKNFNKWLWNHSSLYQFTRSSYNQLEHSVKHQLVTNVSQYAEVNSFDSKSWDITKKLIRKLQSEVRENGGRLAVVHFGEQLKAKKKLPLPLKQFDKFLSDQNIAYLNTFELFGKIKDSNFEKYFIPNDGHFNELGHAKFGELTVEFLEKLLKIIQQN
jgi:lysophospholipase L1-like esterase